MFSPNRYFFSTKGAQRVAKAMTEVREQAPTAK